MEVRDRRAPALYPSISRVVGVAIVAVVALPLHPLAGGDREPAVLESGLAPRDVEKRRYLDYVHECADILLESGTDRYGPVHTPVLVSILDVRTRECPREPLELEEAARVVRRGRRAPAGSNLYLDQPLLRALYELSRVTGDGRHAAFADRYIAHCTKSLVDEKGFFWWGWHRHYDVFTDTREGHAGSWHEIHVQQAMWPELWAVNPGATAREIEAIWRWHVVDHERGECNRHGDGQRGCDFAMSGGEILAAFAFLHSRTGEAKWLERARLVARYYWKSRDPASGLIPNRPNAGRDRFDGHHFDTSVTGLHCHSLLRAHEWTRDPLFRDLAVGYLRSYASHGHDGKTGRFWGSLNLDGTPVREEPARGGYAGYEPRGLVDLWEPYVLGYSFPVYTAQAYAHAHELTGDPDLLETARRWARCIQHAFPPRSSSEKTWYREYAEKWAPHGTYAGIYGRTISFFLHLHRLTGERSPLEFARRVAREALSTLYYRGLIRGHPRKPYYEAVDGVGYLLLSLIQLDRVLAGEDPEKIGFENW